MLCSRLAFNPNTNGELLIKNAAAAAFLLLAAAASPARADVTVSWLSGDVTGAPQSTRGSNTGSRILVNGGLSVGIDFNKYLASGVCTGDTTMLSTLAANNPHAYPSTELYVPKNGGKAHLTFKDSIAGNKYDIVLNFTLYSLEEGATATVFKGTAGLVRVHRNYPGANSATVECAGVAVSDLSVSK